jgi:hypothetical protein
VNITLGGFVLFLHIGVAIVAFMIAGILHLSLHAISRAKTVGEMRPFAGFVHRLEPLLPIFALALFGLGAWLIHLSDGEFKWSNGWIVTAITALVVIEASAGVLLAPRSKKLVAMIEAAPDGAVSDDLRCASLDPMIWDLAHIATVGFLGVVFVMADKPSGGTAALIVGVAAAIGVVLSRWQISMAGGDAGGIGSLRLPGQRAQSDSASTASTTSS